MSDQSCYPQLYPQAVHLSYLLIPLEEKGVGGPTQTFRRAQQSPHNSAAAGASCLPIGGNLLKLIRFPFLDHHPDQYE
jgi:hypothetical protein